MTTKETRSDQAEPVSGALSEQASGVLPELARWWWYDESDGGSPASLWFVDSESLGADDLATLGEYDPVTCWASEQTAEVFRRCGVSFTEMFRAWRYYRSVAPCRECAYPTGHGHGRWNRVLGVDELGSYWLCAECADLGDGPEVACKICTADTMRDVPAEGGGWLCDSCAEWCDGNRAEAVSE